MLVDFSGLGISVGIFLLQLLTCSAETSRVAETFQTNQHQITAKIPNTMHIAFITAGGAGMFCGSCMHDNTLARALTRAGHEVSLIPTYTPLKLDDSDQSVRRVFMGGLNVYLNSKYGWWKNVPHLFTRWLDRPAVIRWATSFSVSNDATELGDLTLSMLEGSAGPHQAAIEELASYLQYLKPDLVLFSNVLLAGMVSAIRSVTSAPVMALLQGDDLFLDSLTDKYREQAIQKVSEHSQQFQGFLTYSEFYRDYISSYLKLPQQKFRVIPLGIDTQSFQGTPKPGTSASFRVGYFARMAPEKGLHNLVNAFVLLRQRIPHAELRIGGYQGGQYADYLKKTMTILEQKNIPFTNVGSPETVWEKSRFFEEIDVFSLPTDFLEPKGMPVLEAMANGVPVVQPTHGIFPEVLKKTRGGILVPPKSPAALAEGLFQLYDPQTRLHYANNAHTGVRTHYSLEEMVTCFLKAIREV